MRGFAVLSLPTPVSTCPQRQSQVVSAVASLFGMTAIRIMEKRIVIIARERIPMSNSFFLNCSWIFQRAATGIEITRQLQSAEFPKHIELEKHIRNTSATMSVAQLNCRLIQT
jgi:hypothetical protein